MYLKDCVDMNILKQTPKMFWLSLAYLLNNKARLCYLLMFPFMAVLLMSILFPINFIYSFAVILTIIPTMGLVFYSLTFNFRNSSLYLNMKLTKQSNIIFYISQFLILIFIAQIVFLFLHFLIFIFATLNLLLTSILTYSSSIDINFKNIYWDIIFLTFYENVLITMGILFLLKSILKEAKIFYLIIFILLITTVFFGSILNSYINITWYDGEAIPIYKPSVYSNLFFIPSLFFPYYATGDLVNNASNQFLKDASDGSYYFSSADTNFLVWLTPEHYDPTWSGYEDAINNIWKYNLILITPLLQIIFWFSLGIIFSKLKNN